MGLLLMKFTYCRMVSALILPIIQANKPFVIFAQFLKIKNCSVSCENKVSILFLALANKMNVGIQFIWFKQYGHSSVMCADSNKSSCTSSPIYPLSPVDAAIVISQLYVLHVVEVCHACF